MSKAKWSIAATIIAGVAVFSVGMLRAQNDLQEQERRVGEIPTGVRDGDIAAVRLRGSHARAHQW